jgi:hypothetical protein
MNNNDFDCINENVIIHKEYNIEYTGIKYFEDNIDIKYIQINDLLIFNIYIYVYMITNILFQCISYNYNIYFILYISTILSLLILYLLITIDDVIHKIIINKLGIYLIKTAITAQQNNKILYNHHIELEKLIMNIHKIIVPRNDTSITKIKTKILKTYEIYKTVNKPLIVFIIGIPGLGKNYISNKLVNQISNLNIPIINIKRYTYEKYIDEINDAIEKYKIIIITNNCYNILEILKILENKNSKIMMIYPTDKKITLLLGCIVSALNRKKNYEDHIMTTLSTGETIKIISNIYINLGKQIDNIYYNINKKNIKIELDKNVNMVLNNFNNNELNINMILHKKIQVNISKKITIHNDNYLIQFLLVDNIFYYKKKKIKLKNNIKFITEPKYSILNYTQIDDMYIHIPIDIEKNYYKDKHIIYWIQILKFVNINNIGIYKFEDYTIEIELYKHNINGILKTYVCNYF